MRKMGNDGMGHASRVVELGICLMNANIVTFAGSPPNGSIYSYTHRSAARSGDRGRSENFDRIGGTEVRD